MKKITLYFIIQILLSSNIYSQCFQSNGDQPAFEINVPTGIVVDSAVLIISNYNSSPVGIRSRGRSFNNFLTTPWFEQDGAFSILNQPLTGPIIADFQVDPGLDDLCGQPNDALGFDWTVRIYCSGITGTNINYTGSLGNNLANPTNIGAVFDGMNSVSGAISDNLAGTGVLLFPDMDSDGFGSQTGATLFCSDFCDPMFVTNSLDCDDTNPNIYPNALDIPNNGIDEDCNGVDSICFVSGTDTRTECNPFTWIDGNNYTANNNLATFNIVGGAANGCDSIVTLDLTINSVADLTTSTSGVTISANNTLAIYQWLDCDNNNAVIPGETGQSFTASANGNYAVELSENGCVDTSACVAITTVGIVENSFEHILTVYPNPTHGNFSIDLGAIYESSEVLITDISGKLIDSKNISQSQVLNLSIREPAGIYIVSIQAGDKKAVIRLVKD